MDQTLQAASERFLDSLRAKSPRTRSTYATGLRRFTSWAREEAGSDEITLDRLDDGALEGFYLALADELGPSVRRPSPPMSPPRAPSCGTACVRGR